MKPTRQQRRRERRSENRAEAAARGAGPDAYQQYVQGKLQASVAERRAHCAAQVAGRIAAFLANHVPVRYIRFSRHLCPTWYMAFWAMLFQVPSVIRMHAKRNRWPALPTLALWGCVVSLLTLAALVVYTPAAWLAEQVRHWGYHVRRDDYVRRDGAKGLIRLRIRTWFWRPLVDEQHEW